MALLSAASLLVLGLGVTSASAVEPKVVVQSRTNSSTSLDVSWSKMEGATAYRIQYSTDDKLKKSVKSLPDVDKGTDATITGLDPDKTYYVQVTALDDKGAAVGDSTVVKASTTYPFPSVGDIHASKVTKSSMVLSWADVAKDVPGYAVEVSLKDKKTTLQTPKNSVSLSNLKTSTSYSVKVHAAGKNGEALSQDSPAQSFSTSAFDLAAPDDFKQGKQGPRSFEVSWDAVDGLPDGAGYVVEWSLATTFVNPSTTKTITSTKTKIDGLKENQTYYARAWVVDADGKRVSAKSDYITTKTLVDRGTLSGDVSGAPSGDLLAVAYDKTGQAAAQVPVSGGHYQLDVRPSMGPYRVQVLYVGPPPAYKDDKGDQDDEAAKHDYTSLFVHKGGDSGWVISEGIRYDVKSSETTKVDDLHVTHGNYIRGTVRDREPDPDDPKKWTIRDVDVTAISGADPKNSKAEREVIGMARTDANGHFIIAGLPNGDYWLRFRYAGTGRQYDTLSQYVKDLEGDVGLDVILKQK